jgi:hypothetical protein
VGAGAASLAGYFANFPRTLHQGAALALSARWFRGARRAAGLRYRF